jgi:hypothetical protein
MVPTPGRNTLSKKRKKDKIGPVGFILVSKLLNIINEFFNVQD